MSNEPQIIWEKWTDPFGLEHDRNIETYYDDEDTAYESEQTTQKNHVLVTSMGIIPYNEATDCSKIFNFWVGHTNFDITNYIANLIQSVSGVETLDIFTRYRFRVAFGKAFIDREVMNKISSIISQKNLLNND